MTDSIISERPSTQVETRPNKFDSSKETKNGKNLNGGRDLARPAGDAELAGENGEVVDAVWGKISQDGPNYRNLGWLGAAIIEVKIQVGLGILGLPLVFRDLGLVVGVLVIVIVGIIITWSDYVIGLFKKRHPEVYTIADCGRIMGGKWGEGIVGFMYWLQMTAVAGSGLIGVSTALNAVSLHGTCTVVFVVVAAIATILISSIRTLDRISWLGWFGMASIMAAIITLMVSVGIQERPSLAPQTGDWNKEINVWPRPSFVSAMNAVSTVVFAYCATPAYISIVGEMKRPQDYNKSIYLAQTFITTLYLIVAGVVYHYVGQYIASPALGSAGLLMKRISYGLALPGLLVTCVLFTHLAAKAVFVRFMRRSKHLTSNSWQHWTTWIGCVSANTALSFVIAEAIPFFGDLLSLIGALLGTFICVILEAYMYMFLEWRADRTRWQWKAAMVVNAFLIILGWYIVGTGTYAAAVTINDSLNSGQTTSSFSCADNSNSV